MGSHRKWAVLLNRVMPRNVVPLPNGVLSPNGVYLQIGHTPNWSSAPNGFLAANGFQYPIGFLSLNGHPTRKVVHPQMGPPCCNCSIPCGNFSLFGVIFCLHGGNFSSLRPTIPQFVGIFLLLQLLFITHQHLFLTMKQRLITLQKLFLAW